MSLVIKRISIVDANKLLLDKTNWNGLIKRTFLQGSSGKDYGKADLIKKLFKDDIRNDEVKVFFEYKDQRVLFSESWDGVYTLGEFKTQKDVINNEFDNNEELVNLYWLSFFSMISPVDLGRIFSKWLGKDLGQGFYPVTIENLPSEKSGAIARPDFIFASENQQVFLLFELKITAKVNNGKYSLQQHIKYYNLCQHLKKINKIALFGLTAPTFEPTIVFDKSDLHSFKMDSKRFSVNENELPNASKKAKEVIQKTEEQIKDFSISDLPKFTVEVFDLHQLASICIDLLPDTRVHIEDLLSVSKSKK